jgi:hypothetical protein
LLDRRGFLTRLALGLVGTAAAATVDLDKLLWEPGRKTYFLPPEKPTSWLFEGYGAPGQPIPGLGCVSPGTMVNLADPETGISIRFAKEWHAKFDRLPARIDVLYAASPSGLVTLINAREKDILKRLAVIDGVEA